MYTFKIGEISSSEELLQMRMLYKYERVNDTKYYMLSNRTSDRYVIDYDKEKQVYTVKVQRKEKNYEGVEDWQVSFKYNRPEEFEITEVYMFGEKIEDIVEIRKFAYVVFCIGVLLYNKIIEY